MDEQREDRWEAKSGSERIAAFEAWVEARKLATARAVMWAMSRRHAQAWPDHSESDRRFREAWLALECEALSPAKGWEPRDGEQANQSESGFEDAFAVEERALTAAGRSRFLDWLADASPMARIAIKHLGEAVESRRQRGRGGDS